jgi:carboxyl-terminal processing protease
VLAGALALLLLLAQPASCWALSDAQQLVVESWRLVNQSYVDPDRFEAVNWRRLRQKAMEKSIQSSEDAYGAIEAMLAPLGDPYTRLLRPADFASLKANTEGTVSGVGLQLGLRPEAPGQASEAAIVVIAPLEESPADQAGIVSGSDLVRVDGVLTSDLGLEGTAARLRGPAGSRVLVQLRQANGSEREVELERREVAIKPVRERLIERRGHRLGYVRISQFSEPVPAQLREALGGFERSGVEGVILDLRNNSGGLVAAGLASADDLLDGQPIVATMGRDGLESPQQASPGSLYSGPMVTLVNGGTASASEILAGALQDDGRSPLLGERTFGKGLIQTLIGLGNGSGLAVTVARYATPSGRDIQNQGIEPDQRLAGPEPLDPGGSNDAWLESAATSLVARLEASVPAHPAQAVQP